MQYALTLSRWHKVAERINAALKERETEVKTAFTATTISPWNKPTRLLTGPYGHGGLSRTDPGMVAERSGRLLVVSCRFRVAGCRLLPDFFDEYGS